VVVAVVAAVRRLKPPPTSAVVCERVLGASLLQQHLEQGECNCMIAAVGLSDEAVMNGWQGRSCGLGACHTAGTHQHQEAVAMVVMTPACPGTVLLPPPLLLLPPPPLGEAACAATAAAAGAATTACAASSKSCRHV